MVGVSDQQGRWYLNINTAELPSGNYRIESEITVDDLRYYGIFKKYTNKLFYISPKS